MSLRLQLLLLSLVTLVLPWAGCQYLRATENALRAGQQSLLAGIAQSVAADLADGALAGAPAPAGDPGEAIYLHSLRAAPVMDGYVEDWGIVARPSPAVAGGSRLRLLGGTRGNDVFLFADVTAREDATVEIATGDETSLAVYRFATGAPGALVATTRREPGAAPITAVRGYWTATADGFHLEARLPRALVGERLGVLVESAGGETLAASYRGSLPGPAVKPMPAAAATLGAYRQPGLALAVVDPAGWLLARVGEAALARTSFSHNGGGAGGGSLLAALYRRLLGTRSLPAPPPPSRGARLAGEPVRRALAGETAAALYRLPGAPGALVTVAVPVHRGDAVLGAVVVSQSTAAVLTLTDAALTRLAALTLLATLLVALALVAWASWLSLRVRRLARAADRAVDRRGELRTRLPSAGAGDELGDLARSFERLLERIGEYNAYLRTLAGKLSHELRTPLAVVTSSLDNLEREAGDSPAKAYAGRAREGAARLEHILRAMSEASRVEQAVETAEPERFDLAAVVAMALDGYRSAYPGRRFELERVNGERPAEEPVVPVDAGRELPLEGSPELVVQMLDKLIDNAADFSPEGSRIRITLADRRGRAVLAVANEGPPLPEKMRGQLFDSLVSVRERDAASHLGLGLHIAQLVAEAHGGRISAENLDGGHGAVFTVELPLAPAAETV